MAVSGKLGHGSKIEKGDGASPEVFTVIPGMTDIQVSGFDIPSIDVTHHASTSREITHGLRNLGTVSAGFILDSADTVQAALYTDWAAKTIRNYKVTFTDTGAQVWTVRMYIQNIEQNAPIEDKVSGTVTWQATAAPSIA